MAISFQLLQTRGTVRESGARADAFEMPVPASGVVRGSAAGRTTLLDDGEVFDFVNYGDAVYVRVQLLADAVNAANDANSVFLATGNHLPFGLPAGAKGSDYCIDVRATV